MQSSDIDWILPGTSVGSIWSSTTSAFVFTKPFTWSKARSATITVFILPISRQVRSMDSTIRPNDASSSPGRGKV